MAGGGVGGGGIAKFDRNATTTTQNRWEEIINTNKQVTKSTREVLFDNETAKLQQGGVFDKNIENFIGTVKIPVGIVSPVLVNGVYRITPIATTEAALVASLSRGCKAINASGGARSVVVDHRISRSPVFTFESVDLSVKFVAWINENFAKFQEVASTTTRHGKLIAVTTFIEGNRVDVRCEYTTADASGQNITTFATKKIVDYIREKSPLPISLSCIEGGHASDKKASAKTLLNTRGRKVIAEVTIPKKVVHDMLHTTPELLVKYRTLFVYGHIAVGQLGTVSGNVANALAGIYIACGQDPATVSESHIGLARFELTEKGDVYCSMTLPDILVGSVGGGTSLPSQKACLDLTGIKNADELAELCAVICLAGEISIQSSFTADDFAKAHYSLARSKL